MKRIYLLLFLAGLTTSAFAQRMCDLVITQQVTAGRTFVASDVNPKLDTVVVTFKNLGPDSVKTNDTLWVKPLTLSGSGYYWSTHKTIQKDSSFNGYYTFTIGTTGLTQS